MGGLQEQTAGRSPLPRVHSPRGAEHELLRLVAACLSVDCSATAVTLLRGRIRADEPHWPQVVAFANRELLAPALWVALSDKNLAGELPAESASRLRRAHAVNSVRNDRMRSELEAVIRRLNEVGIAPVLLKGAVELFVNRYTDPGVRVLRDFDLFVPAPDHGRAVEALTVIGYRVKPRDTAWSTYATDLSRTGSLAPIDLQWFISGQRDLLPPDEAWRSAIVHRRGDLEFRTLSVEHQLVHNLLHSELQDRGSDVGFVWLRQLLDFVALCRLHRSAIDWSRITERFAHRGLGRVPVARLYMAEQLLGLPMPAGIRASLGARLHYRRCLAQLRWRWPMAVGRLWATLTNPLDARLLDVIYGFGGDRRALASIRVRHGLRLITHYWGSLPAVIRKRRREFE